MTLLCIYQHFCNALIRFLKCGTQSYAWAETETNVTHTHTQHHTKTIDIGLVAMSADDFGCRSVVDSNKLIFDLCWYFSLLKYFAQFQNRSKSSSIFCLCLILVSPFYPLYFYPYSSHTTIILYYASCI